jgi:hypothetical protein
MKLVGGMRRRPVRWVVVAAVAGVLAMVSTPALAAGAVGTESVYADGQTYQMIGATLLTQASPGLLSAPPIYLIGFPGPAGTTGPLSLPSGYVPQCDPCNHGAFPYHDHVLTGAPGFGTSGTAQGDYKAPWRIVVMLYTHDYAYSPNFVPLTSDDDIATFEGAGDFVPLNPNGPDHYQVWTNMVLICPIVSPKA